VPGWNFTGQRSLTPIAVKAASRQLCNFAVLSVSWRVAERLYASGTVLHRTGRSQDGGQRREGGREASRPGREARGSRRPDSNRGPLHYER
jgi:hypothetical protein